MALILEVLDPRSGEVQARYRLGAAPLAIGRGYDNDVILDDPYVDTHHARVRVDEDGVGVIEDLGSVNRLVASDDTRLSRLTVHPGMVLRVGRTRLRFQDTAAPLPPALPDGRPEAGLRGPAWLGTWWGQLGFTGVAAVALGWRTWLGTWTKDGASEAVTGTLGLLMVLAVWAGIWAVATRVVAHRFRYLAHLAVASVGLLVASTLDMLSEWGSFLVPDHALGKPLWFVVWFGALATLVAAHLTLSSSMTRRRRWLAGVLTSGVIFAGSLAVRLVDQESFSDTPEFAGILKPAPSFLLPAGGAEALEGDAVKLKERVDALVARMADSGRSAH